jgi:hypothetical protein
MHNCSAREPVITASCDNLPILVEEPFHRLGITGNPCFGLKDCYTKPGLSANEIVNIDLDYRSGQLKPRKVFE